MKHYVHLVSIGRRKHQELPLYNICTAKVSLSISIQRLLGRVLCDLESSEEIKDKMKGQRIQRNEYKKLYGERDQDKHKEYENSNKSIRNLVQLEQMEVKTQRNKKCKLWGGCVHKHMQACRTVHLSTSNCVDCNHNKN